MQLTRIYARAAVASLLSLAALAPSSLLAATPVNTPFKALKPANDHGPLAASKQISVNVHLTRTNEAGFKSAVDAIYEPGSPTYHHWMTDADLKQYEPSPDKIEAVTKELASHGLTVVPADKHGFMLHATGTAAAVEEAFGTQLHEFDVNGKTFRAPVTSARLTGAAGDYVSLVSGLESHRVHTLIKRAIDLKTGLPVANIPFKTAQAVTLGSLVTDQAITSRANFTFTTPGASLPVGGYDGDVYDVNPNLVIAFTPSELRAAYGLPAIGTPGYDGKGQTIVLLEAYGDPTMMSDANAFFSLSGLPALTSSTFSVVYPEGPPALADAGVLTGWDVEISLDIQSAHSIAPAAKIVVVAAAGEDDTDFEYCMSYITDKVTGTAVSDSWEEDEEAFAGVPEAEAFEDILIEAAAKGISFQFSSGDSGDNGIGAPLGAEGIPSDAPHATSVGGTAILNDGGGFRTTGWGDQVVILNEDGVLDPPEQYGFVGGGGGGESIFFPKPKWQSALPGTGRSTPDVSALADPYTGVIIVVTEDGVQYVEPGYGGTSLASPIFTAFWAISQQIAGGPLGEAGAIMPTLSSSELTDVVPYTPAVSVTGFITDKSGTTEYTSPDLFAGLIEGNTGYTTAIWPAVPGEVDYAFAFGLDSSLTVTKGFDYATGYGTPRGENFINAVAAKK
jgi:subtilase family serine protease